MKAELEKRADRAAQDIMNLLAQALIECGVWSIPLTFQMSKSRVAALILTRFQELGPEPEAPPPQVSGPRCKNCGAFTTQARVDAHGLCMKCEIESKSGEDEMERARR